ncbi:MAG: TIGR03905 family TSCPD domain-containing protein [Rikenellaceae bacterium]
MEKFSFRPSGVCCKLIDIEIDGNTIKSVKFHGGCDGNLQGISRLVIGQKPSDVSKLLKGVDCRGRGTSCPDQLAIALSDK